MPDPTRTYDFSKAARTGRPLVGRRVRVLVVFVAALCVAGFLFREPLLGLAGPFFDESLEGRDLPRADEVLTADMTDDERLMYALTHVGGKTARDAIDAMVAGGDQRYTAVLIEAMVADEVSPLFFPSAGAHNYYRGLMQLIGDESLSPDSQRDALSRKFFEWYAKTDLIPPPGFVGWKAQLLARVDPVYDDLLYEGVPSRIRIEEVRSGGVDFDGIPALDNPKMLTAEEAVYLDPREPVFGLAINDDVRAYPERILEWHEMANDVVGGVPVSLAYCTLCGSAIAYDGRAADGKAYTFGSSGLLYRSNKLMYDRQTMTLWNHLTGRPVIGALAATAARLELLPVVTTTWGAWRAQHPNSKVADIKTGYDRRYEPGAAYGRYFASRRPMFPVGLRDNRLPMKSRVYGLDLGGETRAYSLDALIEVKVINDTLGGAPVVLVATRGTIAVDGSQMMMNRFAEEVSFDAGGEVRVFDRGAHTFQPGPDPDTLLDENGRHWQVMTDTFVSESGESLKRLNGVQAYWFAWYQFHQDTDVYQTP